MEFGIWSNGFRPHTSAAETFEEDLQEIILADQLGMRDCYVSEHHGEPVYINKVDTLPVPELLMCKAAGLTKQIRMGAAVTVIHLWHPVDVAIRAATTDHVIGNNRFFFGFGSGFQRLWDLTQWPLIIMCVMITFNLVYYFAPDRRQARWRWFTIGSFTAFALWLLVSYAFRIYLHYFDSYSKTYGSLGAVIILMLWFYLMGAAIIIGAEINQILAVPDKE